MSCSFPFEMLISTFLLKDERVPHTQEIKYSLCPKKKNVRSAKRDKNVFFVKNGSLF